MRGLKLLVLGGLAAGTLAVSATPATARDEWYSRRSNLWGELRQNRQEVREGQAEMRKNYRELAEDRRELRQDLRNGAGRREIARDRAEIRDDLREIARDRRELNEDIRDYRQDLWRYRNRNDRDDDRGWNRYGYYGWDRSRDRYDHDDRYDRYGRSAYVPWWRNWWYRR